MKSEAVVVGTRETGNLVKLEKLGKVIEKAKKLRKHKHLHHNNMHIQYCIKVLMLFYSTSIFSSTPSVVCVLRYHPVNFTVLVFEIA